MRCPYCRHPDSRVVDSREADDGALIRRRRSCPECGKRFTTVEEADARDVLDGLNRAGHLPPGFLDRLEYIGWSGEHKDLRFVPGTTPDDVLLVDDDAGWIHLDQTARWVPIAAWDGGADDELARVRMVLAAQM